MEPRGRARVGVETRGERQSNTVKGPRRRTAESTRKLSPRCDKSARRRARPILRTPRATSSAPITITNSKRTAFTILSRPDHDEPDQSRTENSQHQTFKFSTVAFGPNSIRAAYTITATAARQLSTHRVDNLALPRPAHPPLPTPHTFTTQSASAPPRATPPAPARPVSARAPTPSPRRRRAKPTSRRTRPTPGSC